MSSEIGPVTYTSGASIRGVLFQGPLVRNIDAEAWATPSSAIFSSCLFAFTEVGTTGIYYADLPAGVAHNGYYSLMVYLAAATDFDDATNKIYDPIPVTPNASAPATGTGSGDVAQDVVARAAYMVHDSGFGQASQAQFLSWLAEGQQDAISRRPALAYNADGTARLTPPKTLSAASALIVPSAYTGALVEYLAYRYLSAFDADQQSVPAAQAALANYQRLLGVA